MRQQEQTAVQDNVDLIVEAIKVMEDKVNAQLEIAKSIVPEKGDKGDKGKDGKDGKNGLDGKDGKNGINGTNGIDGKDGVSVIDAKIDFDGSLIISLSTGQQINVGEVVASDLRDKIHHITTMSTNTSGSSGGVSSVASSDSSVTVTTVSGAVNLSVATAPSTPKLLTTNFTIEESGGKLLFKYGTTTIASMSSTGVITSATNIVANGTP
jgi:hypothetical protein